MTKIVINTCYGGFGLSSAAMLRYAEIKGITLYPEVGEFGSTTYFTVPPEQREVDLTPKQWAAMPMPARVAHNEAYSRTVLSMYDITRDDPVLVQVVEEMGAAAGSRHSALKVVEIPDNVEWTISDYDGIEHIAERHRTWS